MTTDNDPLRTAQRATIVRRVTEWLRVETNEGGHHRPGHVLRTYGEEAMKHPVTDIDEDFNGIDDGTTQFDGRALAFHVNLEGFDIRVTVEDVTLDEEVPKA